MRGSVKGELTAVGAAGGANSLGYDDNLHEHENGDPMMQMGEIPRDFRDIQNPDPEGEPLTEKQQIVMKLRVQNESLKGELKGLGSKLEAFMQR